MFLCSHEYDIPVLNSQLRASQFYSQHSDDMPAASMLIPSHHVSASSPSSSSLIENHSERFGLCEQYKSDCNECRMWNGIGIQQGEYSVVGMENKYWVENNDVQD